MDCGEPGRKEGKSCRRELVGWGSEGAGGRGRSERAERQVPLLPDDWPLGAGRVGGKEDARR